MKRELVLASLSVALVSCATSKPVYLPDGRQGHTINCDGSALSWSLCYEKAGEICEEKGYDILAKEGEDTPTITGSQFGVFGGSMVSRSLVIACKN